MEEIIENIHYEIKCSGYEKKLIGGIVITGGGAQLKHLSQLMSYMTGMDTRIGYPNEHLSKGFVDEVKSPLYATAVGLVIKGVQKIRKENSRQKTVAQPSERVNEDGNWLTKLIKKGGIWLNEGEEN